jgi:hypothetical protein
MKRSETGVQSLFHEDLKQIRFENFKFPVIKNGFALIDNVELYIFAEPRTIYVDIEGKIDGISLENRPIFFNIDYKIGNAFFIIKNQNMIETISDDIEGTDSKSTVQYIRTNRDISEEYSFGFEEDGEGKVYLKFDGEIPTDVCLVFDVGDSVLVEKRIYENSKLIIAGGYEFGDANERQGDDWEFDDKTGEGVPRPGEDKAYNIDDIYDNEVNDPDLSKSMSFDLVITPTTDLSIENNIPLGFYATLRNKKTREFIREKTIKFYKMVYLNDDLHLYYYDNTFNEETDEYEINNEQAYDNFYENTDSHGTPDGTYTAYSNFSSSVTTQAGTTDFVYTETRFYENAISIFATYMDENTGKVYTSNIISLERNQINKSDSTWMFGKSVYASQEAYTASGKDIWNYWWKEDRPDILAEPGTETPRYDNKRNWKKYHYFLERPPINYANVHNGEDGSVEHPYTISNVDDFIYYLNMTQTQYKYLKLIADIDVHTVTWTPNNFKGILDGQDYKIYGLTNTLFDNIEGTVDRPAVIKKLIIEQHSTTDTQSLLCNNAVNAIISNVSASTSVGHKIIGTNNIGGLVKSASNTRIENSCFIGEIQTSLVENSNCGGLVGYLRGTSSVIDSCFVKANISNTTNTVCTIGGLIGRIDTANCNIQHNYTNVNISGQTDTLVVGGLIGLPYNDQIPNVKNNITLGNTIVGALNNFKYSSNKVFGQDKDRNYYFQAADNCSYRDMTINGELVLTPDMFNGQNKTSAEILEIATYSVLGFDFELIWQMPPSTNDFDGFPVFIWTQFAISENQDGTAMYPWLITSEADLIAFRDLVESGTTTENKYWRLTRDLNFDNLEILPIGIAHAFNGNFNGNNHEITGLTIIKDDDTNNPTGLFSVVRNASISNLSLEGNITSNKSNVGILCGASAGNTKITNISVEGTVTQVGEENTTGVGLLIGSMSTGTVINCETLGTISQNDETYTCTGVGGVIGSNQTNEAIVGELAILNNETNCEIECGYGIALGGIIGYAFNGNIRIRMNYNFADTAIFGHSYIGGLIGRIRNNTTSTAKYNLAIADIYGSYDIGGLVGQIERNVDFSDNSFTFISKNGLVSNGIIMLVPPKTGQYREEGAKIFCGGIVGITSSNIYNCFCSAQFQINSQVSKAVTTYVCGVGTYDGEAQIYNNIVNFIGINIKSASTFRIGTEASNQSKRFYNNYAYSPSTPAFNDYTTDNDYNGANATIADLKSWDFYANRFFNNNIWRMSTLYASLDWFIDQGYIDDPIEDEPDYERTSKDEIKGRYNFNDYYDDYYPDEQLDDVFSVLGSFMHVAMQGYLGHIKISGQQLLDANAEFLNCVKNQAENKYTIAYNLQMTQPITSWAFPVIGRDRSEHQRIDFYREYEQYHVTELRYNTDGHSTLESNIYNLEPNYLNTTDVGITGSFEELMTALRNNTKLGDVEPEILKSLLFVFYLRKKIDTNNPDEMILISNASRFIEYVTQNTNDIYFRGLAVIYADKGTPDIPERNQDYVIKDLLDNDYIIK